MCFQWTSFCDQNITYTLWICPRPFAITLNQAHTLHGCWCRGDCDGGGFCFGRTGKHSAHSSRSEYYTNVICMYVWVFIAEKQWCMAIHLYFSIFPLNHADILDGKIYSLHIFNTFSARVRDKRLSNAFNAHKYVHFWVEQKIKRNRLIKSVIINCEWKICQCHTNKV